MLKLCSCCLCVVVCFVLLFVLCCCLFCVVVCFVLLLLPTKRAIEGELRELRELREFCPFVDIFPIILLNKFLNRLKKRGPKAPTIYNIA